MDNAQDPSGCLATVSSSGFLLDVKGIGAEVLDLLSNVLKSQDSSVGRKLITISFDILATSNIAQRFTTKEIGKIDEISLKEA